MTDCPPGVHSMFDPCPGNCTEPVARVDEIRDLALDTLGEWIEGYTSPDSGPQLRIRTVVYDVDALGIDVEEVGEMAQEGLRHYTITISVQEQEES